MTLVLEIEKENEKEKGVEGCKQFALQEAADNRWYVSLVIKSKELPDYYPIKSSIPLVEQFAIVTTF